MPLEFRSLPALTNGVSRQAPVLRLDSQAQDQENYLSSVSDGLIDRPAAKLIRNLSNSPEATPGAFYHAIDRDSSEQFIVKVPGDGTMRIWDLAGNEQTVNAINAAGQAYLTTVNDPREVFGAHSIVDVTFFSNREIITAMDLVAVSPQEEITALIWVKSTSLNVDVTLSMHHDYGPGPWSSGYQKKVDPDLDVVQAALEPSITRTASDPEPTVVAHSEGVTGVASDKQSGESTPDQAARIRHIIEFVISDHIAQGYNANGQSMGTWSTVPGVSPVLVNALVDGSDQRIQGSILVLTTNQRIANDSVRFVLGDSQGNSFVKVIHREVENLEALPKEGAPIDFAVKVVEEGSDAKDDWYVQFDGKTWKEIVGFEVPLGFDVDTMPHTLTRNSGGDFTFTQAPWAVRTAGDEISAPAPDFIGKGIEDVTLYKNRLTFIFNDGSTHSESSEFFNFWPTTVRQLLDSDPFSLTVDGGTSVPQYRYGITYDQVLLLVGAAAQATIKGTDIFSASTVSADLSTEFDVDVSIPPLPLGRTILIPKAPARGGAVLEYVPGDRVGAFDGVDITAHIPGYLPSTFNHSSVGRAATAAVFMSDSEPNVLYAYRYFFDGDGKAQASWSRWPFHSDLQIHGTAWFSQKLYLITRRVTPNSPSLELLELDFALPNDAAFDYSLRLDMKDSTTVPPASYDPDTDKTTFQAPYFFAASEGYIAVLGEGAGAEQGKIVSFTQDSPPTMVFDGELPVGATVWVGLPYERRYVPSEFRIKQTESTGRRTSSAPLTNSRLQLRRMKAELAHAGYLRAEVSRSGTLFSTKVFSPQLVGDLLEPITPVPEADFEFHIGTNARDVEVALINDSHLPCTINALSYEVLYHNRAQRSRG